MDPFSWTLKLGPNTTSSPRRRGRGLHNPDSSYDQIQCFCLAEVRNFTNIMIEYRSDKVKIMDRQKGQWGTKLVQKLSNGHSHAGVAKFVNTGTKVSDAWLPIMNCSRYMYMVTWSNVNLLPVWALKYKIQWNLNPITLIFFAGNVLKNVHSNGHFVPVSMWQVFTVIT